MQILPGVDGQTLAALITAFAGLVTTVMAVTKYLSRRDKQIAARNVFRTVVDSLSSEAEVQRLGAAILLRRFFDPETELGQGRTPYAREAIDVIAAILRDVETGNFQKLLADGLRYAPSLQQADLQRTNLQKAYLGSKGNDRPNLRGADFYRADLSGASLKGALAAAAVFYQARLHKTILKNADLRRANFFEADLLGASFAGAYLYGANFTEARNLPPGLSKHIGSDGTYTDEGRFEPAVEPTAPDRLRIFLSKPGTLSVTQRQLVDELGTLLAQEDVDISTVEREDYPGFGAVSEVRRVMTGCSGAVILGFRELEIRDAVWRLGTEEARDLEGIALPTAWNHVEAGMAAMAGLPILVLAEQGVVGGLFELEDVEHIVMNLDL
ncbi:MAG: hypothetical protein GWN08_16250, partial [Gemmatimonadetes bacterium]|nr:pentapeptide repeat-containing protein [Gemmatimonadota bacterium]NIR76370.1 pentapeptide repeat-containing protein [Candidatus Kutchimonas denitrificans]NIW76781.1 hypothetical protein [Gemmatimonadota bacterium]